MKTSLQETLTSMFVVNILGIFQTIDIVSSINMGKTKTDRKIEAVENDISYCTEVWALRDCPNYIRNKDDLQRMPKSEVDCLAVMSFTV